MKHNTDGSIERYKTSLIAKWYIQRYGVDYQETFVPVAKMNSVRILLSVAANKDWALHQFDIKNTFLHGDLKDEVYMDIPLGFDDSKSVENVCKLKKFLYSLNQYPRVWFERFTHLILK